MLGMNSVFTRPSDLCVSYLSRILKLLNQRKLESLKETWWNQNPEKKNCDDEGKNNDGISIKNIGLYLIVIDLLMNQSISYHH